MANILLDTPDALLERIETLLVEINGVGPKPAAKTSLTKSEREEAQMLSQQLGAGVGKIWADSLLRQSMPKISRRALMVQLLTLGLEHIDKQAFKAPESPPISEKLQSQIKANQRKRGSLFA